MTNRLLIVDDEPMLSGLLVDILQSKGFTCFCVNSGKEAMEFLKTNTVDLIISDFN